MDTASSATVAPGAKCEPAPRAGGTPPPLQQLLRETSIAALLAQGCPQWGVVPVDRLQLAQQQGLRPLVAFSSRHTIGHALERLLALGLRTAPVFDNGSGGGGLEATPQGFLWPSDAAGGFPRAAFRGFVEAAAVIEEFMKGLSDHSWPPSPPELEAAGHRLCALPLHHVVRPHHAAAAGGAPKPPQGAGACPWPAVQGGACVLDAVGVFVSSHAQHLLVLQEGGAISGVVSQSDVVRFLAANLPAAGNLAHSSLAALGLAGRALAGSCRISSSGGGGGERHSSLARAALMSTHEGSALPHSPLSGGGGGGSSGGAGGSGHGHSHGHGHGHGGCGRAVGWRLVTVPETATALDSLRIMHAKGVSGVAVVASPRGDLVGHFGAADVRCLAPGVFHQLLAPVRAFLAQVPRPPRGSGAGGGAAPVERAGACPGGAAGAPPAAGVAAGGPLPAPGRVLCAQATSSLGSVVAALVRQRVHRIYVTDSDCSPVGVVTCTDVLDALRCA
ncbi:MAG: hypothetical protein J3K34DRAFT_518143 [Monoraphidium minutum]|nr:MAG: hypothetical protein J3K34DRAFT_518143 [Monoraphidium minutum]